MTSRVALEESNDEKSFQLAVLQVVFWLFPFYESNNGLTCADI